MQNLSIANIPPAAQAQAPTPQDNGADPAAEPFGSVLARQRASAASAGGGQTAADDGGGTSAVAGDSEMPGEARGKAPEITGDMLAALLSADAGGMSGIKAAGEDAGRNAQDAEGAAGGSGSMLAALLPSMAMMQDAAPSRLPDAAGERKGAQMAAPLLTCGKDDAGALAANGKAVINRDDIFSMALEASGKVGTTALFRAAAESSAQNTQPDAAALAALPQTGTAPLAAGANAAAQARLSTPLTGNAWGGEFAQSVVWMATQHEQTAELHLNPPNLGPLDVLLSVSGDQATALFSSQHAAVRNAVEQALPKLREMLADNGIMLGNATVGDQLPGERQEGPGGKQQNGGNWPAKANETIPAAGIQAGMTAWHGRRHEGMVDTFA